VTHEPPAAEPSGPRQMLATLRPQTYGKRSAGSIRDPIVEPLWTGLRALAGVEAAGAAIVDSDGAAIGGMELVLHALAAASQSDDLVVDGYLTRQSIGGGGGDFWAGDMPSMGALVGLRRKRPVDPLDLTETALEASAFGPDDEVMFVAIDLLWLDGTSLLDVPLLERRRLLQGILVESDAVRLGVFVRPPIDSWVGSWRAQGFNGLTFKAANSRYLPGEPNPDWVVSGMPRR